MVSDVPWMSPYFPGMMWRLFGVLGLLLIWALVQPSATRRARVTKVLTACWLGPLLVLAVFAGGIALFAMLGLILVQALREYRALVGLRSPYLVTLVVWSLGALALAGAGPRYLILVIAAGLFLFTTLIPIVSGVVDDAHRQVGTVLFGYMFIVAPLACIMLGREVEVWGLQFLLVVGTAIALADAGAFVVGSWLRGPRLAPTVSPNKTWTGVCGAVLGAAAGIGFQWPLAPEEWDGQTAVVLIVTVALGAVWGDLVESFVKRDFGRKDAGTVLAGFGGVLDRFDSYLVGLPLTYVTVLLLNQH